jgi:hypothetical protein
MTSHILQLVPMVLHLYYHCSVYLSIKVMSREMGDTFVRKSRFLGENDGFLKKSGQDLYKMGQDGTEYARFDVSG